MLARIFNEIFHTHTIEVAKPNQNPADPVNKSLVIKIKTKRGVSTVEDDTLTLARAAVTQPGKTVLEVGTGTGLVALCLSALGHRCLATDVNPNALRLSQENAFLNGLTLPVKHSDLFEEINEIFDIIIFNPPYMHAGTFSRWLSAPLEFAKSLVSRKNLTVSAITYKLIKKQRRQMVTRFLAEANRYLSQDGRLLVVLHTLELNSINQVQWKVAILATSGQMVIVSLCQVDN